MEQTPISNPARRCSRALGIQVCSALLWHAALAGVANAQAGVSPRTLNASAEAREYARPIPDRVREEVDVSDRAYPSGDVASVYRAALDELYYEPGIKPRLVLLHELAEIGTAPSAGSPLIPRHKSRIDSLTIQDFLRLTASRRQIRPNFAYRFPLLLLTRHSMQFLPSIGASLPVTENSKSVHPFWLGFMHAYPEAWGFAVVTQVGFNPARTQAILQVMHRCGPECGSIEMMFLRKEKRVWKVAERMTQQANAGDLGYGNLRYRGVGDRRRWVERRAEAVADSVRRMRLPRPIQGIVTDSATGDRIALARVVVVGGYEPHTLWDYAYSDSRGRYAIPNLPLGYLAVAVSCPKYTVRAGDPVKIQVVTVMPASDTKMNFAINLKDCAKSR